MEFVFVLPLLVVLVFGIIQFGIAYNRSQGMHAAAREGARLASIGADVDDITRRVESALGGTAVDPPDVTNTGVQVRWYLESEDPADKSDGTPVTGTVEPCNQEDADAVRVDLEVTQNASDYAITIPLLPSFNQTFPSQAIFRCEE